MKNIERRLPPLNKETEMTKTASITIEGELARAFQSVRNYMIDRVPGIKPNNAEVVRAAILMAANQVPAGIAGSGQASESEHG